MKISTKWLKEWLDYEVSTDTLVQDLTMGGIEVDCVEKLPNLDKVVIGEVLKCEQHPNADKLKICQVSVGLENSLQIICGASNVRQGLKVAVAMIGAKLPNDLTIKAAKLRGENSQGMLCSTNELGLISQEKGILEVDENQNIGDSINEYLALNDEILELDITPNRGDCFSTIGIARELSVYYKKPLKTSQITLNTPLNEKISTTIIEEKACPKYLTQVIKGIDNRKKTPQWMVNKLLKAGLGLNSAIVDITNFVMLELGQPTHAFDLEKVSNLSVRYSKNEKLILLGGKEVILDDKTLVIADDEKTLAIAGVMGGLESSVTLETSDIVLESAFFTPKFIAGCARKYGLHTESSLRFERGVDFKGQTLALNRISDLIVEILGGEASTINENFSEKYLPKNKIIEFNSKDISQILGLVLDDIWIEKQLKNLGFIVNKQSENNYRIEVPSFRFDVVIVEDLAEELARLYGYDKLPVQMLANKTTPEIVDNNKNDILAKMINDGYQELINYSFIDKKTALLFTKNNLVELKNPISQEMAVMRPSLIPGLLKSIDTNKRNGSLDCRFFETGLCFDGIKEEQQVKKLAAVITGNKYKTHWRNSNRVVDFYDLKAILEDVLAMSKYEVSFVETDNIILQKGQAATIIIDGKKVGFIGKLSPHIASFFSINDSYVFEIEFACLLNKKKYSYQSFSNFQASKRDLSVVIDKKIKYNEVIKSIKETAGKQTQKLLTNIELFDVYQGDNIDDNKRSLAFSLTFQAMDKTLKDNEIEIQVEAIFLDLKNKFSAIRRE